MQPSRGAAARIDFDAYLKDEPRPAAALARAFRTLLSLPVPGMLDLCDRRIEIAGPLDLSALTGLDVSRAKHLVCNGTIAALKGGGWTETTIIRSACHDPTRHPTWLFDLNTDGIEVGARLGKECGGTFVRAVDRRARSVEMATPPWGVQPRQIHTFHRARYAIDLSMLGRLEGLTFERIAFDLDGMASGVLLAPEGGAVAFRECTISAPRRHAIASPGSGCRGLRIERCLIEGTPDVAPACREALGIVANGDDVVVRDSVLAGFSAAIMLGGTGHLIADNEFAQARGRTAAIPTPAIVLTGGNAMTQIRGNRFANGAVHLSDRHRADEVAAGGATLGGVVIEGNAFEAWAATATCGFVVAKPFGPGRALRGIEIRGNSFNALCGGMQRVERTDESYGSVDSAAATSIGVSGNVFRGLARETRNPVTLRFEQPEASECWILDPADDLAFGAGLRSVVSVVPEWPLLHASGRPDGNVAPQARAMAGHDGRRMELHWPRAVRGCVTVTLRCDAPC